MDWAEDMNDQPISESDIQRDAAKENWVDMANLNMQLHGELVSLMEECKGFEFVRNTKTEVGLDAWRRLNHKYDPRNPLRNIQLQESGSHRRKLAMLTWSQAWRDSSKNYELFVEDSATTCRISGDRYTWCASRRSVRRSSEIILQYRLRPLTPRRNRD